VLDIEDQLTEEQHQQLLDFLAGDEKNITNSVMDNADGYALVNILGPNWDNIDVAINNLSTDKRPEWGDLLCAAASACVTATCWAGGIANPVCGYCSGVAFACAVMDFFGLWIE
jgi:hypothetical protein